MIDTMGHAISVRNVATSSVSQGATRTEALAEAVAAAKRAPRRTCAWSDLYAKPWFSALWEHVAARAPEAERSIADGEHRRAHATPFEITQQLGPWLGGLAITIADRHQVLAAIGAYANEHEATQTVVFQAHIEVHAVGPEIHVVHLAQVALLERCELLAPFTRESLGGRRAQPCRTAEELRLRRFR